jgi:hypothetical protein
MEDLAARFAQQGQQETRSDEARLGAFCPRQAQMNTSICSKGESSPVTERDSNVANPCNRIRVVELVSLYNHNKVGRVSSFSDPILFSVHRKKRYWIVCCVCV